MRPRPAVLARVHRADELDAAGLVEVRTRGRHVVDLEAGDRTRGELGLGAQGRAEQLDRLPARQPQDREVAVVELDLDSELPGEERERCVDVVDGDSQPREALRAQRGGD